MFSFSIQDEVYDITSVCPRLSLKKLHRLLTIKQIQKIKVLIEFELHFKTLPTAFTRKKVCSKTGEEISLLRQLTFACQSVYNSMFTIEY